MAAAIPRHLLETLVNCPACSQRYNEPRVLPTCGHTVCKFEYVFVFLKFYKYKQVQLVLKMNGIIKNLP
jgi:hypothetical protein